MIDADWRWFYAGYQLGFWSELMPSRLNPDQFQLQCMEVLGSSDFEWVIECYNGKELRPIGVVLADFVFRGCGLEPHVTWFPWASTRNRLEGSLQFISDIGKLNKLHIWVDEEDVVFWNRVHKYKTLRKQSNIPDGYGPGNTVYYFISNGPFK